MHAEQPWPRQIGTATSRHDRFDGPLMLCRRHQGCSSAGTGSEIADVEFLRSRLRSQPTRNGGEPFSQQVNVEPEVGSLQIDHFLARRQKIDQKSSYTAVIQHSRDVLVSRTMPAASAAVSKDRDSRAVFRNIQVTLDLAVVHRYMDQTWFDIHFT